MDENIKKVREELEEEQRKNATYEFQMNELKEQLEELAPLREVEMDGLEPAKVKELSQQVTDLEDTRNHQAALIEKLETKISNAEAQAMEFKGKVKKMILLFFFFSLVQWTRFSLFQVLTSIATSFSMTS